MLHLSFIILLFLFVSCFFLICYVLFIFLCSAGWVRKKIFFSADKHPKLKISVIVPFRNEEKNLELILNNLADQNYPSENYEVIAVNDHSVDGYENVLEQFEKSFGNFKLLSLPGNVAGKKQALHYAIQHAINDYVMVTDADCSLKNGWLKTFSDFYFDADKPEMILGLVDYKSHGSFFSQIQNLEFLSLIATGAGLASIGRPVFCNGANLFFSKKTFQMFNDAMNNEVASGDDTFLLHHVKKHFPGKISVLKSKEALVTTIPPRNLKDFFQQRIRWASKSKYYNDSDTIIISLLVLGTNLFFLIWFVSAFSGKFNLFIPLMAIKIITDAIFFFIVLGFFRKRKLMLVFPAAQLFYPVYIVITALFSFFGQFSWKERKYKK
jgi:poly-beta-1,6-N-acetyl-D-glucosamine synthase